MKIEAKLNYLRLSPRKVRLVAGLIRGLSVKEAKIQLQFLNKRSAKPTLKLLQSAIANAKQNFSAREENLFISSVQVNEGRTFKRWRPRSRGRAAQILKRTSQIKIVLEPREGVKLKKVAGKKPEVVKLTKEKTDGQAEIAEKKNKVDVKQESQSQVKPYQPPKKLKKKFSNRRLFSGAKKMFRRKSF